MKVLLVDDEFEIRESIKSMLTGLSFEVIMVADAVSALMALKDNEDIKYIITDYRMPGLGGKEWIELLKYYHPNLNLLVISGYEAIMDNLEKYNVRVLKKPFDKYQLIAAMGL